MKITWNFVLDNREKKIELFSRKGINFQNSGQIRTSWNEDFFANHTDG